MPLALRSEHFIFKANKGSSTFSKTLYDFYIKDGEPVKPQEVNAVMVKNSFYLHIGYNCQ